MTEFFGALLLGVVQGVTEFAPVSSTAHLVLIPWVFGWQSPLLNSLTFDVALHMGTLGATLTYFWREWARLARAGVDSLRERSLAGDPWRMLAWLIVLGTIPGAVVGVLFEEEAEAVFRAPWLVGTAMILLGLVLAAAERVGPKRWGLLQVTPATAFLTGVGQATAILPGVSRSGGTMTVALFLGLEREAAARFSFLLATPIMLGAGLKKLGDIAAWSGSGDSTAVLLGGFVASAFAGYLCIKYLLRYLQGGTLYVFVWYRIIVGLGVLALYFVRSS